MARSAAAPGVFRCLALEIPWDKVADRGSENVVIRDTESGEEGEFADQHGVLEAAGGRRFAGGDVKL